MSQNGGRHPIDKRRSQRFNRLSDQIVVRPDARHIGAQFRMTMDTYLCDFGDRERSESGSSLRK